MARHLHRLGETLFLIALSLPAAAQDGAALYATHCLTCHQADGNGVPFMQPPLVGSEMLSGPAEGLIAFVLTGNQGPSDWGNPMGSFAGLSDAELAAVLTYSRQAYGEAGPVEPDLVAEIRDIIGP